MKVTPVPPVYKVQDRRPRQQYLYKEQVKKGDEKSGLLAVVNPCGNSRYLYW